MIYINFLFDLLVKKLLFLPPLLKVGQVLVLYLLPESPLVVVDSLNLVDRPLGLSLLLAYLLSQFGVRRLQK